MTDFRPPPTHPLPLTFGDIAPYPHLLNVTFQFIKKTITITIITIIHKKDRERYFNFVKPLKMMGRVPKKHVI
jgi:hypothetical protein